ncbi:hypothetical protein BDC45DRAFT_514265 [Circinella umbellata]|nr:hypothetical protein BDC45DRAFT_514265 [Circinella umbellata]
MLLSIQKVCSNKTSTTSNQTKASIVGRLTITTHDNPDPKRRKGTLFLNDLTTNDSIYLRVDLFHHELANNIVQITQWNHIKFDNNNNIEWIEASLNHIYPIGTLAFSSLQQILQTEQIAIDLLANIPDVSIFSAQDLLLLNKRCLASSCQQEKQEPIHVVGRVSSKPVRSLIPGRPAEFYIELIGFQGDTSTMIIFTGDDLLNLYHTFQTDHWYVFMYMKTGAITIDNQLVRGVLQFVSNQSRCYQLDKDKIKQIKTISPSIDDDDEKEHEEEEGIQQQHEKQEQLFLPPPAILRPAESTSMTTYEGIITRVIEPSFGVYELDHDVITCLFHYTDYSLVYPYRQGTRIRLSCVHMLGIGPGSTIMEVWDAPTMERGDYKTHIILVGCLKTHIQIIEFPNHIKCSSFNTRHKANPWSLSLYGPIFKECINTQADFDSLIQKLEIQASLIHKFKNSISSAKLLRRLCRVFTNKINKTTQPIFGNDWYHDIFQHEQSCSAVKTRASSLELKRYPYVSDIVKLLLEDEERTLQLSRHPGERGSSREDLRVDMTMALHNEKERNLVIMGIVDAMPDGRLYILDDTGKLPLVVLSEDAQDAYDLYLGDLYRVREFELVKEDLGYQEEGGSRVLLDCNYIVCDIKNLKHVAMVKSVKRTSMSIIEEVDYMKVKGFKRKHTDNENDPMDIDNNDDQQQQQQQQDSKCDHKDPNSQIMLHILEIQPPILSYQQDNSFELISHIQAIRYPVVLDDKNNQDKRPQEVHLILSSQTTSLRYLPQLYPGCWVVLSLLNNNNNNDKIIDEFQVVETVKYNPKKMKLPPIPPTLVVDPDRHQLITTHPTQRMIEFIPTNLTGVYMPSAIKQIYSTKPNDRIYQVKDIIKTTSPKKSSLLVNNNNDNDKDSLPSMVEIGKRFFEDTVNVQGVIVDKGFREQASRAKGAIDTNARQVFEELGVGTGQSGRNQLFFRVRQTDELDTVDIYMDAWNRTWPLGLIPGALVTFYHLVRKKSDAGLVMCQMLPCSYAKVSEQLDPRSEMIRTKDIPSKKLQDLIKNRKVGNDNNNNNNNNNTIKLPDDVDDYDPLVFKTICSVKSIICVNLWWKCGECGTVVKDNKCYRLCKKAKRSFMANALAVISDGTFQARAHFDGERLVFKLLNIQDSLVDGIKTAVLEYGKVTYSSYYGQENHYATGEEDVGEDLQPQGYDHLAEEDQELLRGGVTLPKLCRRVTSTGKIYTLFASERAAKSKKDATIMQQLNLRAISIDSQKHVAIVKEPRIVVVELELMDPAACAWDMVMQLDNICTYNQQVEQESSSPISSSQQQE